MQRHILTKIIRATFLTTIWSVAFGDFSGILVIDPSTIYQIASLKFDRNMEAEADREAAKMLDQAEISREGMIDFLKDLSEQHKYIPEFLSTHPGKGRELTIGLNPSTKTSPALSVENWQVLKSGK